MKLFNVVFVEVGVKLRNKSLQLPHLYFTIRNRYMMLSTALDQSQQSIWLLSNAS